MQSVDDDGFECCEVEEDHKKVFEPVDRMEENYYPSAIPMECPLGTALSIIIITSRSATSSIPFFTLLIIIIIIIIYINTI